MEKNAPKLLPQTKMNSARKSNKSHRRHSKKKVVIVEPSDVHTAPAKEITKVPKIDIHKNPVVSQVKP